MRNKGLRSDILFCTEISFIKSGQFLKKCRIGCQYCLHVASLRYDVITYNQFVILISLYVKLTTE